MDAPSGPETTRPDQTADSDLERRIVTFLLERGLHSLRCLEVEVHGGLAVIRGNVRTYHEKQLATCCCQRVAGVLQVVNDVRVLEQRSESSFLEEQTRLTAETKLEESL